MRSVMKKCGLMASSLVLLAGSLTAFAGGASAYGGEQGQLLVHGPGAAYTSGHGTYVSIETIAGGTATFALEVKNTGTAMSQYNLHIQATSYSCAPGCPAPTLALSAGSLITTPVAEGPNGYFTAPIAAGKTALFSMKVTLPKLAPAGGTYFTYVELQDTAHNVLGNAYTETNVTEVKGTSNSDELVTGAGGQKPLGDIHALAAFVTNPSTKLGGTSVFLVKLQNDSSVPSQIKFQLADASSCAAYFPAKVKVGTIDVTSLALAGTYITPVLAAGKFVTLTVTVTFASTPLGCSVASDLWTANTTGGDDDQTVYLVTNPIAI